MEGKIIVDRLSEMGFRIYSEDEVLNMSVKEITNPQLFDSLDLPTNGGLYDRALGKLPLLLIWFNPLMTMCAPRARKLKLSYRL